MAVVTLSNLGKNFGRFIALENFSLEIADGEFLVLLGPSGCGKTTTMRMVAGLETPTSGDILIDGVRVNDKPARERDLAMVFQNYGLYPHMSVGENIGYPLKVRGIRRADRKSRVVAAADRVELVDFLQRKPDELSGGQRQRVALARAIVRKPKLFLMDEPLSNLDAKLRTLMRGQLKHLQNELKTTTIYVTHDQVEAMTLADRIVILNNARIQQVGPPAHIYAHPVNIFVAGFIGSPPMNLLTGTSLESNFKHSNGLIKAATSGVDGAVTLGQRPEHLTLTAPGAGDLTGTVFSSELLGDAMLVNVTVGNEMLVVKTAPHDGAKMGETVGICFDVGNIHLFDIDTGDRLDI
ncbi:MAG: ABC transporter ATP-binding protein [Alphaproteobacteria bacterium]|nr:ABC transporter ATP-binding protein [Alphaproteobacteria bacterium]